LQGIESFKATWQHLTNHRHCDHREQRRKKESGRKLIGNRVKIRVLGLDVIISEKTETPASPDERTNEEVREKPTSNRMESLEAGPGKPVPQKD
jgi:hypothetical protein